MTNELSAFFLAIGSATWVYKKFFRSTGGNTQSSLIGAGAVGVVIFLIAYSLLNLIPQP